MRTAGEIPCRRLDQSANRCIRAMESPPPETASAQGAAGEIPSRSNARSNRTTRLLTRSAALVIGALAPGARGDGRRGVRIFCGERDKGGTTFLHLTQFEQRKSELEHSFGCSLSLGIFLQQL